MRKIAENQFIGDYKISDEVCNSLVELFHKVPVAPNNFKRENPEWPMWKEPGGVGDGETNLNVKNSMDLKFSPEFLRDQKRIPGFAEEKRLMNNYVFELNLCFANYAEDLCLDVPELKQDGNKSNFDHCNFFEGINLQYYAPGGGFYANHYERGFPNYLNREYVYMTYLNDVPNGGTYFYYQDKTIEAKKGRTLIWPAHYTHIHRGQISKTHEKYIMTGWMGFPTKIMKVPNQTWDAY